MDKMKGAILYGPLDVRLEDVDVPAVGDGEVLARVKVALTCGTDVKVYRRGGHPRMIRTPSLFGHEWAGEIVEVGKGVEGFQEGDRIVAANSAPCFKCYYCGIGRFSLCENLTFLNGAYAEYIKIPVAIVKTNLYKIPPAVSFEEAAFLEPLACVVHGVEEIEVEKGEEAVINGAGPIGLLFLLLLKNIGAKVTVVEKDEERLRIAEKLGCEKTISPARFAAGGVGESTNVAQKVKRYSSDGKGMDIAIEATGVPEVWEESIGMVKGGGRVLLFGGCKPGTKACMDTKLIHYSEILLKGVFHHTPAHVRKAHELIATKKLNLDRLITHRMRLDSISEALEKLIAGEGIKIIIIP